MWRRLADLWPQTTAWLRIGFEPADLRVTVGTKVAGMTLVSADKCIRRYPVTVA